MTAKYLIQKENSGGRVVSGINEEFEAELVEKRSGEKQLFNTEIEASKYMDQNGLMCGGFFVILA